MPINAQVLLSVLSHESTSGDISQTLRVTPATYALSLGDGTGANQAQVAWSDSGALAASGNALIDLLGLADERGDVSFSAVKVLYISNTGQTALSLETSNQDFTDEWSGGPLAIAASALTLPAGSVAIFANPSATGWPASGQAQVFRVVNASSTTAGTYDIVLIGEGTIT